MADPVWTWAALLLAQRETGQACHLGANCAVAMHEQAGCVPRALGLRGDEAMENRPCGQMKETQWNGVCMYCPGAA